MRAAAEAARGFMPPDEGLALHDAAASVTVDGPFLEIGSYCGKSAVYLGAAARARATVLFSVDHHRGSEENQPGWEWHEPDLVDPAVGKMDTLPLFRRTIHDAGLEGTEPAHRDYELWTPKVVPGGLLAIHDVFPDPADGGRPPYEIYCRALESGRFEDVDATGSLRVLRRT